MTKVNLIPLNFEDYIGKFIAQSVLIFSEEEIFLGKGLLVIDLIKYMNDKSQLEITVKENDVKLESKNYILKAIIEIEGEFIKLHIGCNFYNEKQGMIISHVKVEDISILEVTESDYHDFSSLNQQLDWKKIRIPIELKGKDKVDEADAFEALCLDIIGEWGAKNIDRIGKGPDRARDGCFKVEAHSWIPIITDYSNSWILQCKYSKDYDNLQIDDIYKEAIKVIMHKPDYYLLMTNRKLSSDFYDWFREGIHEIQYYIPFKCILIDRQQIESVLAMPTMSHIKKKYFE